MRRLNLEQKDHDKAAVVAMEVASAMDYQSADTQPLQIRYQMQNSELLYLTMIYIGVCFIGQIVAIPVSWLLFPRTREPKQPRGEPGGDLWAADAICLLLFSIALKLGLQRCYHKSIEV